MHHVPAPHFSRRHLIWWTLLSLLLGLVGPGLGLVENNDQPASASTIDDESRFVALINELRAGEGLAPVAIDEELTIESRQWAEQLRIDGSLSHAADLSVGVTSNWTKLGENVGVGPVDQLQALFDAFVASPDHYANLIDPDFRFVGVGVVHDSEGRIWTTHRFMAVAPIESPIEAATGAVEGPETSTPTEEVVTPAAPAPTEASTIDPLDHALVTELSSQLAAAGF